MFDEKGHEVPRNRFRKTATKLCNLESWKRRLPITIWLPKYRYENFLRDLIAGVTVGLTSIPQGIAYAMVAGLPPQVGLYSSVFPGIVYAMLGSCKDVTVGPTAILAALLAKYVALSPDFAYLASFLTGCVIMLLGIFQLGFLLDFISKPVISGFTTAAALQISASQLKSLFRISGSSGGTFIDACINFCRNIKTVHLWDTVLGVVSIVALLLIKSLSPSLPVQGALAEGALAEGAQAEGAQAEGARSEGAWVGRARAVCVYAVRARNALVVFAGLVVAYVLSKNNITPFALTGPIHSGLPRFGPPPFSTVVNNQTLHFGQMLEAFGPQGLVMPLVAILETIAIAKAFAGGAPVDATQEMVAVGACNVAAALAQGMPATGSFTRTALNHACGVSTPAGSIFKASLVLLAVTLLAETFYFIPRATLAGIIIVAMMSIIELRIVGKLWRNSKAELCVWALTVCVGATLGLEYGIAAGAGADVARVLAGAARPRTGGHAFKVGAYECACVSLEGVLSYACAERLARRLRAAAHLAHPAHATLSVHPARAAGPVHPAHPAHPARALVLDGARLVSADLGVFESIAAVLADLQQHARRFLLWNFKEEHQKILRELRPDVHEHFVSGPSVDQFILGMEYERRD